MNHTIYQVISPANNLNREDLYYFRYADFYIHGTSPFSPVLHSIDLFVRMSYGIFYGGKNRLWAGYPVKIFLPVNIDYKV